MATSSFPTLISGVTVETATVSALSGDGSSGDKLAVEVDGVTIDVNGSNELEASGDFESIHLNDQPVLAGVADDANDSEPMLVVYKEGGTGEVALAVAYAFTDGNTWSGLLIQTTGGDCRIFSQINGSGSTTNINLAAGSGGLILDSSGTVDLLGARVRLKSDMEVGDGKAIKTDTTTAHTALIQAYDVNGTTYRTFVTLTNGDVPSCTISQPTGGILALIPPTADPHVAGAIWNNTGILAISMG